MTIIKRIPIDYQAVARETGMRKGKIAKSPLFGWGVFDSTGSTGVHFAEVTVPEVEGSDFVCIEKDHWCYYKEDR